MKAGFIGLGHLGRAMTERLASQGVDLILWNRTPEKATVLEILAAGAGASGVLSAKKDKLLQEDFSPQFQSALIYKDLHYLQDLAFQLKKPVFLASAVKEMYGLTYARGEEKLDFSALYRILKEG